MKKITLLLSFFSCIVCIMSAQKAYQNALPYYLPQPLMVKSADGAYVYVAGQNPDFGSDKIKVVKIETATGILIWSQEYNQGFQKPILKDMLWQNDGIVLGISDELAPNYNASLLKISSQGQVVWYRKIGVQDHTQLFDIEADNADNIWIAGFALSEIVGGQNFYFTTQMAKDGTMSFGKKVQFLLNSNNVTDDFAKVHYLLWDSNLNVMWSLLDETAPSCVKGNTANPVFGGGVSKNSTFIQYYTPEKIGHIETNIVMEQYASADDKRLLVSGYYNDYANFTTNLPCVAFYNFTTNELTNVKSAKYRLQIIGFQKNKAAIVYDIDNNSFLKLDQNLDVVWEKQIDRCLNTSALFGLVLPSDEIFSIRNIGKTTIVAKFNADGSLPDCAVNTPTVTKFKLYSSSKGYARTNYNLQNSIKTASVVATILKTDDNVAMKAFCTKADARFKLPDTVCIGSQINPILLDSSNAVKHIWNIYNNTFTDKVPNLTFDKIGANYIKHEVVVGICSDSVSRKVQVANKLKISLRDTVACARNSINLNFSTPNTKFYFANKLLINSTINISKSGVYNIVAQRNACTDSAKVKVKIVVFKNPFAPVLLPTCEGNVFPLALNEFKNITWDGAAIAVDTLFLKDGTTHTYKVTYAKDPDCVLEGQFSLPFKKCSDNDRIFIPNSFSPNDDGVNDDLKIFGKEVEFREQTIYDRWGSLVFNSLMPDATWDGQYRGLTAQQGVFICVVRFLDKRTGEEKIVVGDVMLTR